MKLVNIGRNNMGMIGVRSGAKPVKEVKTIDIELAIMRKMKFIQNIIVPNISEMCGFLRFETDMVVLSKSGYATGFEIKVSKSDLKADFKKDQHVLSNDLLKGEFWFRHYYGKFKYFYYAVPEFLLEETLRLVPDTFGVYYLDEYNRFIMARASKELFRYKWTDSERVNLMRLGTMRIYSLKKSLSKYENRN